MRNRYCLVFHTWWPGRRVWLGNEMERYYVTDDQPRAIYYPNNGPYKWSASVSYESYPVYIPIKVLDYLELLHTSTVTIV